MTDMGAKVARLLSYKAEVSEDQVGEYNRDALRKIKKFSSVELLAGLLLLASRWETGDIEIEVNKRKRKFKNKSEAQLAQDYLMSRKDYEYGVDVLNVPDEVKERVFQTLVDLGVPFHYSIVASHRRAIKRTAEILIECGVIKEMLPQYLRHDLSKYGPFEVIGYSVMFGSSGSASKLQELDGVAKEVWDKSVQSHYRDNRHHPEFWVIENQDGTKTQKDMAEDALIESVIDSLACRLERDFKWNEVPEFCCNDEKYKTRYTDSDRKEVEKQLKKCYKEAVLFLGKTDPL